MMSWYHYSLEVTTSHQRYMLYSILAKVEPTSYLIRTLLKFFSGFKESKKK